MAASDTDCYDTNVTCMAVNFYILQVQDFKFMTKVPDQQKLNYNM